MTHSRSSSSLSTRSDYSQCELGKWREALNHFDFSEYREAFQVFTEMEPKAKVYHNMAMCLIGIGDYFQAIKMLRAALEADPFLSLTSFHLGCLLYEKGEYNDAISSFQESLRVPD